MKILITGGAGFIGGHLSDLLIKNGHEVTAIDDLSTGRLENLEGIIENKNFEFIEGDILELPELHYLIARSDVVYHLAAAVGVELVVKDPVRTIVTNVHGTERVLKGAARKNTRIIVASTSEVYGKSSADTFQESNDLLIGPSTHSRWSYACSKLLDEFFAMAYNRQYDLPITVVRFFNTVGPRQTGRYGMVLPRFVSQAREDKPISVFGDGEQTRCFCHVWDTIRALEAIATADNTIGNIYNIGSTELVSINELAKRVIELVGSKSNVEYKSYDEAYGPGFEDMQRRMPNISCIKEAIGWEPKYTLKEIISTVNDYYESKK